MCSTMNEAAATAADPRTISTAADIIEEYCSVVHDTEHMMFGAPESLLPYPREKIQQAAKVLLNFMSDDSLWEPVRTEYPEVTEAVLTNRYFNNLKEAYARLAKFVPDTDAELAARANALFDNHAREQIEAIRGALCSPWYKKARDLQRKLNDQAMSLLIEIEEEYGKKFPAN